MNEADARMFLRMGGDAQVSGLGGMLEDVMTALDRSQLPALQIQLLDQVLAVHGD